MYVGGVGCKLVPGSPSQGSSHFVTKKMSSNNQDSGDQNLRICFSSACSFVSEEHDGLERIQNSLHMLSYIVCNLFSKPQGTHFFFSYSVHSPIDP